MVIESPTNDLDFFYELNWETYVNMQNYDDLDILNGMTCAAYSGVVLSDTSNISKASFWIGLKAKQTLKKYCGKWMGFDSVANKIRKVIPVHSFVVVKENDKWILYESHFSTGVVKRDFSDFVMEMKSKSKIFIMAEDELSVDVLNSLVGKKYGTKDILGFVVEYFFPKRKSKMHKFDKGIFCSELVSMAQTSMTNSICKWFLLDDFQLDHCQIEPIHHALWIIRLDKSNYERISFNWSFTK